MRGLVFATVSVLFLMASAYADSSQSAHFEQRWIRYPVVSEGLQKSQLLERVIFVRGKHFQVGTVTNLELPKEPNFSVDKIQKDMAFAMGFESWTTRSVGNAKVFEQHWKKGHRFYRLYIAEREKTVRISVALFRTAYFRNLYVESEVMQRIFTVEPKGKVDWANDIFASLANWAISEARADGGTDWEKILSGAEGSIFGSSGMPVIPEGTLKDLTDLGNNGIKTFNDTKNQFQTDFDKINKQMDDFKQIAKDYEGIARDGMALMDKHATIAEGIAKDGIKLGNRALDITEKAMQPKNIFAAAFAGAAGAALGVTAANLAVQGVKIGIKAISDWISGDHKKQKYEDMLLQFRAARESWEKLNDSSKQIEDSIDLFIRSGPLLRKLSPELLMQHAISISTKLATEIPALEGVIIDDKKAAIRESKDGTCGPHRFEPRLQELNDLNRLVKSFTSKGGDLPSHSQLCSEYLKAMNALIDAEFQKEALRVRLVTFMPGYLAEMQFQRKQLEKEEFHANQGKPDRQNARFIKQEFRHFEKEGGADLRTIASRARQKCEEFFDKQAGIWHPSEEPGPHAEDCQKLMDAVSASYREKQSNLSATELANFTDKKFKETIRQSIYEQSPTIFSALKDAGPGKDFRAMEVANLATDFADYAFKDSDIAEAEKTFKNLKEDAKTRKNQINDQKYSMQWSQYAKALESRYAQGQSFGNGDGKVTDEVIKNLNGHQYTRLMNLEGKRSQLENICNNKNADGKDIVAPSGAAPNAK